MDFSWNLGLFSVFIGKLVIFYRLRVRSSDYRIRFPILISDFTCNWNRHKPGGDSIKHTVSLEDVSNWLIDYFCIDLCGNRIFALAKSDRRHDCNSIYFDYPRFTCI